MKRLLTSLCLFTSFLQAELEQPVAKQVILADKRIHESSGIARSLRHPGVFWTHNDSGGEPCVFAVDAQGKTLAKMRVPKAANFDWEDIASGPDAQGKPSLFIADIGDNLTIRPTVQIYQIPEPDLPDDPANEHETAPPQIWHVAYPDRPHNAESLLVHPQTGRLYIVTKSEDGNSALYALPHPLVSGKAMTLEKILPLTFPALKRLGKRPSDAQMTTAASFSPDGSRLVIATYNHLQEWRIRGKQTLVSALAQPAQLIEPPALRQMEAVCYDADGRSLWITSEQLPAPLIRLAR